MRIAIVNSIRVCGGGEKWLQRQAAAWRARGHEPLVICQPGASLEALLAEKQLPFRTVRMPHDLAAVAVVNIVRALRSFRPELLLCCNARAFRLAVPASRLAGRPRVLYRNGLTGTFKNQRLNRFLFRWTDCMVVNAEALREELLSFGWLPARRIRVIRNGVDLSQFGPDPAARERVRREVGTPAGSVVAAILARIADDKGQSEAIAAMAQVVQQAPGPYAELWVVGDGSRRTELEARVRDVGLAGSVRFLGFRSDIPAILQAADVVVQASHREGLGNALLEAMAAGRPVVATSVGGTPQLVIPGETGDLVPPHDVLALAEHLRRLLAEPERRQRYGEQGRHRVAQSYSLDRETDEWCSLFDELAGPK